MSMGAKTNSEILCYAGNLVTYKLLESAAGENYKLVQVHTIFEIQNRIKDNTASLLLFNLQDEQLPLIEILDAFKQCSSSAGLIGFNEKSSRTDLADALKQGVNDVLNAQDISLLPFVLEREIKAAQNRQHLQQANIAINAGISDTKTKQEESVQVNNASTLSLEPEDAKPVVSEPAVEVVKTPIAQPASSFSAPTSTPVVNKKTASISDAELAEMLTLLNTALETNKFQMLFQPLIQLGGDDTEFYEVLLRLPKADGTLMSAGLFMNETQVPDEIKKNIDRWVITKASKLLASHLSKGSKTRMFINLCSASLEDASLTAYIKEQLSINGLASESIIFQFNEEDASANLDLISSFSNSLNDNLIPISLSRFGMQNESMSICRKINPLFVKLNGYFSKNIHQDEALKENTEALLKQLKSDYKIIIMPMVEDVATVSALWKMGTDFVQGFYVQAPQSGVSFDFED